MHAMTVAPVRAARWGIAYFAIVFGVGFVLGPIRVLVLVPRLGERAAELIEAPLMLLAIVLAGRWIGRRVGAAAAPATALGAGALAAGLVLAADLAVGVFLRGLSAAQVFSDRDPVSGTVYYALVAFTALAPWLLGRGRGPDGR